MNRENCHFVVIWEFWVRAGAEERFEAAYGMAGAWVRLFSSDPAYQGTKLVRDASQLRRYLTLDYWDSGVAYDLFNRNHFVEYAAIDRDCEKLTESEKEIGRFEGRVGG